MRMIDAHIHCGNWTKIYTLEKMKKDLKEAGCCGAAVFAFPEDMYRLTDTPERRIEANNYVLEISKGEKEIELYPFYFVWNDFIVPDNLKDYKGIKWHRHPDEPRYDYNKLECKEILSLIKELELPVILEEETKITAQFIDRNPEIKVIIPHMGKLSGGYDKMDIFFDNPNIYFDTSDASFEAIENVLNKVGAMRVIFGSDISGTKEPFYNFPKVELDKLSQLKLDHLSKSLIFSRNIEKLMHVKIRDKIKNFQIKKRNIENIQDWKQYFSDLSRIVGFSKITEQQGHHDIMVRDSADSVNDNNFKELIVGNLFWSKYGKIFIKHPELFKQYLEIILIHETGHILSSAIRYQYDEAIATMTGAESFGYQKKEILDLLSVVAAVDCVIYPTENYFEAVRVKYSKLFFDELTDSEVNLIIDKAISIYNTKLK